MKGYSQALFLAVMLLLPLSLAGLQASAAVVAAIDLSHGQGIEGIDVIVGSCPNCYWILIVSTEEQLQGLPEELINLFNEVRVGGLTLDNLADVSVLLVGQAVSPLTLDELNALKTWFSTGGKALWVAGDSDYPAQGSEVAQQTVNQVLEIVESSIRIDYVSIEDSREQAGRPYRVLGIVDPQGILSFLSEGLEYRRVLFHGPGALYVLVEGQPVNPVKNPEAVPDNVFVIVRTSDASYSVEHQTVESGGFSAEFYDPLNDEVNRGPYPLMIAEIIEEVNSLVIASSETMYGGYKPMTAPEYYDNPLDGPTFVPKIVNFMVGFTSGQFIVVERVIEMTVTETQTVTQEATVTEAITITETLTVGGGLGDNIALIAAVVIVLAALAAAAYIIRR